MSRPTTAPSCTSKSACPVCRIPERPLIRRHWSRASAASAACPGLAGEPSRESAPMPSAWDSRFATSDALAAASRATCSATRGADRRSSTPLTTTSGARPPGAAARAGLGTPRRERACCARRAYPAACQPPAPCRSDGGEHRAGGPGADRRRTAALAAGGERGHDDGERRDLPGRRLALRRSAGAGRSSLTAGCSRASWAGGSGACWPAPAVPWSPARGCATAG